MLAARSLARSIVVGRRLLSHICGLVVRPPVPRPSSASASVDAVSRCGMSGCNNFARIRTFAAPSDPPLVNRLRDAICERRAADACGVGNRIYESVRRLIPTRETFLPDLNLSYLQDLWRCNLMDDNSRHATS